MWRVYWHRDHVDWTKTYEVIQYLSRDTRLLSYDSYQTLWHTIFWISKERISENIKTRNCLHKVNTEFFSTQCIKPKILYIIITDLKNSTTSYIIFKSSNTHTILFQKSVYRFFVAFTSFLRLRYALFWNLLSTQCMKPKMLYMINIPDW